MTNKQGMVFIGGLVAIAVVVVVVKVAADGGLEDPYERQSRTESERYDRLQARRKKQVRERSGPCQRTIDKSPEVLAQIKDWASRLRVSTEESIRNDACKVLRELKLKPNKESLRRAFKELEPMMPRGGPLTAEERRRVKACIEKALDANNCNSPKCVRSCQRLCDRIRETNEYLCENEVRTPNQQPGYGE